MMKERIYCHVNNADLSFSRWLKRRQLDVFQFRFTMKYSGVRKNEFYYLNLGDEELGISIKCYAWNQANKMRMCIIMKPPHVDRSNMSNNTPRTSFYWNFSSLVRVLTLFSVSHSNDISNCYLRRCLHLFHRLCTFLCHCQPFFCA